MNFNRLLAAVQDKRRGETGFSLVELIVVIAIIAILAAIAVPVYGNIQKNARQNAVEGAAKVGYNQARAILAEQGISYKDYANRNDAAEQARFNAVNTAVKKAVDNDKIMVQLNYAGENSNLSFGQGDICVQAIWIGNGGPLDGSQIKAATGKEAANGECPGVVVN